MLTGMLSIDPRLKDTYAMLAESVVPYLVNYKAPPETMRLEAFSDDEL